MTAYKSHFLFNQFVLFGSLNGIELFTPNQILNEIFTAHPPQPVPIKRKALWGWDKGRGGTVRLFLSGTTLGGFFSQA